MPSAPTINFEVRASRWLRLAVVVMALLALVAVIVSRLPWPVQVVVCVLVVAYAAASVRKLGRLPLRTVGWHADDRCDLHLADGHDTSATLVGGRVLGPLIVLRLRWADGGHCALTLLPDSVDADVRRRLRMRLSALSDGD